MAGPLCFENESFNKEELMGQQVDLVLVGVNKGRTMQIKGIQFENGKASVLAPDSKMGGILRYCETKNAFPAAIAAEKQAQIDAHNDSSKDDLKKAKKAADLRAQLAALEAPPAPTPEPAPVEEPAPEPEQEGEAADGEVEDTETPEGREDDSPKGHRNSSRKGRRR
jgi:hypothetical protein